MNYEEFFILHIINCFNAERSVSAVYHLLKGKRTSQTIQDGFLFLVHPYFQCLPHMTRQELNDIITKLEKDELIKKRDSDHFMPTTEGQKKLAEYQDVYAIPSGLNGWFYGAMATSFWKRLTLLIQSLSHLNAGVSGFMPITRDETILRWVKLFLLNIGIERKELLDRIFNELISIWSELPDEEAVLLSHRLSGYLYDGFTIPQLCEATGKSSYEIILLLYSGIHRMTRIVNEKEENTLLKQMLNQEKLIGITDSARKTMDMLALGHSIETIASLRHLKVATVQDHIVERAFVDPTFSIEPFVKNDIYQAVVRAIKTTRSKKLSTIKQLCPDDVQYFHIRLVLARERVK